MRPARVGVINRLRKEKEMEMVWLNLVFVAISVLVAIGSLWVAILSLRKSQQTQNKMLQIETERENDRQLEKQKAKIKAHLEHLQHGRYELIIENYGTSKARNIEVMLNEKPLSDFNDIQPPIISDFAIEPQSSFSCHWKTGDPDRPPFEAVIRWSDDSGQPGHWCGTLNHPTTSK